MLEHERRRAGGIIRHRREQVLRIRGVGAEGEGLRPLVRTSCDLLVSLPMLGRVQSLNVGASAAVVLYEVQRQRRFTRRPG